MKLRILTLSLALAALSLGAMAQGLSIEQLNRSNSSIRLGKSQNKYLMLPIEEGAPEARLKVVIDNNQEKYFTARLARTHIDYCLPLDLTQYRGKLVSIDVRHAENAQEGKADLWVSNLSLTDVFDTANKDQWRPDFHHTPEYAWMNDPNGMFYLDGTWHLYYQYGPYGNMWNNMHWGHSTSTDLINWKHEPVALEPDVLGDIFSGSCVVDHNNTAGFGKGAIIALYTSAGEAAQRQSMAYSTDGGKTFKKYAGNPILSANIPDFRDPNMFWNEEINAWNLILAAGQEMRIYSSPNLKDWKEESRFGLGYGNHGGVWECPDLMKIDGKWVLVCNINPGGPFGGSATQYFVGSFDGHKFVCEDEPYETKWMDYGKDHYATVSFSNAPNNRRTVIAWMSNWEYADRVPTKQFRSANSVARDLFLYEIAGETYVGCRPSPEYDGGVLNKILAGADQTIKVKGSGTWALTNAEGEKVLVEYNEKAMTLSVTRTESGVTSFAASFPAVTTAPVHRKLTSIRVISDKSSVEVFGNNGEVCLTNLVFPKSPLTKIVKK